MSNSETTLAELKYICDCRIRFTKGRFAEAVWSSPILIALEWWRKEFVEDVEDVEELYKILRELVATNVIPESWDVDCFNHNSEAVLRELLQRSKGDEKERGLSVAALTVFVNFLHSESYGRVRQLQPRPGVIVQRRRPPLLSLSQQHMFLKAVDKLSSRDSLIAKISLTTARPISEILKLTLEDFDICSFRISFTDTEGNRHAVQSSHLIGDLLKSYLEEYSQYRPEGVTTLFITRKGNPIYRTHFTHAFDLASKNTDLGFKVSPRMIQWSLVAHLYRREGACKEQIMERFKLTTLPNHI